MITDWLGQWRRRVKRRKLLRPRMVARWPMTCSAAECLESRVLLSNVAVSVNAGVVVLAGDTGDHTFDTTVVGANLHLAGSSGTTFTYNGVTDADIDIPLSAIGPVKGILITMQGGNDTIHVDATGLGTISGNVFANLGDGTNTFEFDNATVAGRLDVLGGRDADSVQLANDSMQDLSIHTGFGNDTVGLTDVTITGQTLVPGFSLGGSLVVDTGAGDDTVEMHSVTGASSALGGWWSTWLGTGTDHATFDSVQTHAAAFVANSLGESHVSTTASSFGGPTIVGLGSGPNQITVASSTFTGPAILSTGLGSSQSISVDDSDFKSVAVFTLSGENAKLNLETTESTGPGSKFEGPVLAVLAGPSATANFGSLSPADILAFDSFVTVIGGNPEATVNIASVGTTLDASKLLLILAKRVTI